MDNPVDLAVAATSFALIFPIELPDKTFVASLVLATRYRPLPVWLGVVAAFFVQSLVAVTAGGVVSLLPRRLLLGIATAMFAVGAFVLLRGASAAAADEAAEEKAITKRIPRRARGRRAALTSFGVLFAAEWGDLSQLLTVGLVVRFQDPVSVFLGSWLSLAAVAGLAVLVGKALVRRVRLSMISRIGGGVCVVLTVLSGLQLAGVDLLG